MAKLNRYAQIIERIFLSKFEIGMREVTFESKDIVQVAIELGIELPKNPPDILYNFRFFRAVLPDSIHSKAPEGYQWIIRLDGRSRYRFVAAKLALITPNELLAETKIPDATPGIVAKYALNDEQALLSRLRYNRLIDIFTGVTCYSLQNHLRTTVPLVGQVETDEIYVGVDRRGSHYVFPVQAKGSHEKLSVVQIEQDFALCADKFPALVCRPIAAQFMQGDLIALFVFENTSEGVKISSEKHYRLVEPANITSDDLETYRSRSLDDV